MKTNAFFAKPLLVAASLALFALLLLPTYSRAQTEEPNQEETAKTGDDEENKIPGTVLKRSNGSFLSITIENNCFKMAFYDAEKKQMAPDIARAAIRWSPKNKKGDERRILNPAGDDQTLVSPPPVQPPHNFRIFVTLLNENNEAVESMNSEYRN